MTEEIRHESVPKNPQGSTLSDAKFGPDDPVTWPKAAVRILYVWIRTRLLASALICQIEYRSLALIRGFHAYKRLNAL